MGELVGRFAQHLVDRYGEAEVSRWYFEVWNEPNIDFWVGEPKQSTYFRLYDEAAAAIKRVNASLRVGGPATAQAAWIEPFIAHAVADHVPLDFVSTHVYGDDEARNVLGRDEQIPRTEMVARAVRNVHDQVKASARPDLPIIWSEYNATYKTDPDTTDLPFMAPWIANTIRQSDGLTEMMAYWTFSDVFEEQGVIREPFYGGYGILAEFGLPKPSFNAFALLHQLGDERLEIGSSSALATRRADGTLVFALWNLQMPETRHDGAAKTFELDGLGRHRDATIRRVDPGSSVLAKVPSAGTATHAERERGRDAEALRADGASRAPGRDRGTGDHDRPGPGTCRHRTAVSAPGQSVPVMEVKPARCMPRRVSALLMNVFHTRPVRTFSAITRLMPVSMPMTKSSRHFVSGLKAFTNPYRLQASPAYFVRIVRRTRIDSVGRNGSEPAAADGTTVPSIGPVSGGPPQTA